MLYGLVSAWGEATMQLVRTLPGYQLDGHFYLVACLFHLFQFITILFIHCWQINILSDLNTTSLTTGRSEPLLMRSSTMALTIYLLGAMKARPRARVQAPRPALKSPWPTHLTPA